MWIYKSVSKKVTFHWEVYLKKGDASIKGKQWCIQSEKLPRKPEVSKREKRDKNPSWLSWREYNFIVWSKYEVSLPITYEIEWFLYLHCYFFWLVLRQDSFSMFRTPLKERIPQSMWIPYKTKSYQKTIEAYKREGGGTSVVFIMLLYSSCV